MSLKDRITRHEATIADLRDSIAWMRETKFSIGELGTNNTEQLVENAEATIRTYESIINRLRERIDAGEE